MTDWEEFLEQALEKYIQDNLTLWEGDIDG